jgi:hypothetical protein
MLVGYGIAKHLMISGEVFVKPEASGGDRA